MAVVKKNSFETWIGTAAEKATFVGMLPGDRYIEIDTNLRFVYTGAAWIADDSGAAAIGTVTTNTEASFNAAAPTKGQVIAGQYMASDPTYHDGDVTAIRTNSKGIALTELTGSNTEDIIFHNAAVAAADGTAFTVGGYKTLTVEILSTADSFTIAFIGEGPSGADIPIMGVNLTDLSTGINTSTSGQLWQFDITGLTKVFMDLTAVTAGVGSVTVKGRAVA